MDRMTKHGSPKSKSSPTKSVKSDGTPKATKHNQRWKSGYALFNHLFTEENKGLHYDDIVKKYPKIKPDKDNAVSMRATVWRHMSDDIKNEFRDAAGSEKAPRVPAENQAGVKFHEWLEEGRIDESGNEVNPPEEDLKKYVMAK